MKGRPAGVTLSAIGCFALAGWSFAAAAMPGVFFGRLIPLFPPLMSLQTQIHAGRQRIIATFLTPQGQVFACIGIGVWALLGGLMLWKTVRLGHLYFLAGLWLGAGYYAYALSRNRWVWLNGKKAFLSLSTPVQVLLAGNVVALLVCFVLISAYLWRRRSLFR